MDHLLPQHPTASESSTTLDQTRVRLARCLAMPHSNALPRHMPFSILHTDGTPIVPRCTEQAGNTFLRHAPSTRRRMFAAAAQEHASRFKAASAEHEACASHAHTDDHVVRAQHDRSSQDRRLADACEPICASRWRGGRPPAWAPCGCGTKWESDAGWAQECVVKKRARC